MHRVALALATASPSAADVSRQSGNDYGSPFPTAASPSSGPLADSLFAPVDPAVVQKQQQTQQRRSAPPVPKGGRRERQRRTGGATPTASMRQHAPQHAGVVNSIKNGLHSSSMTSTIM